MSFWSLQGTHSLSSGSGEASQRKCKGGLRWGETIEGKQGVREVKGEENV